MKIAIAPGRFSTTPAALDADLDDWAELASIIFTSEVAAAARAAVLARKSFTVTHQQGTGDEIGLGECALLTKDGRWKVLEQHWLKLTDGGGKARLAHPLYAVTTVLQSVATGHIVIVSGTHMPAHLERRWALLPLPARMKAKLLMKRSDVIGTYVRALHEWKVQVTRLAAKHHADDVVIVADWNLNAAKKWVRTFLEHSWRGLEVAASTAPDMAGRTIGFALTTMRLSAAEVEKAHGSDHNAGIYTLEHVNKTPANQPDPRPTPPPPFELCTYNGARMDQKTKTAVQVLEQGRLKDLAPLTIFQGCYNVGGVAASAGTHDKGGVLDLSPFEYGRKVKAWRDLCGPAWHRTAIPGLWGEHIHVVMAKQGNLAPAAAQQVVEYFAGQDGLADHAHDPNQHHPQVSFDYEQAWRQVNAA